jgi:deazaflavin-dependent oxidoreductase (nitroreductase family)
MDFRRERAGHRRSVTALLTHMGRRTGSAYQTPVGAQPYGDGFVVGLPYGSHTDWCRNVMAAKSCKLGWKGHTYELERPEIIPGSQVFETLPAWVRVVMRADGTDNFLWLHKKTSAETEPRSVRDAAAHESTDTGLTSRQRPEARS